MESGASGELAGSITQEGGRADCVPSVPLAAAALLVTGTFGWALATGGQDTWQTSAVERNGVFGRSGCNQPSCSRAAGKFRSPPLSMIIMLTMVLQGPI